MGPHAHRILMKASTELASLSRLQTSSGVMGWLADLALVTKARANLAVVATTMTGFALASRGGLDTSCLLHTVAGTLVLACAAAMANQAWEWHWDRSMARTRNRPIPAGRMTPQAAMLLCFAMTVGGGLWLAAFAGAEAACIGWLTFAVYVFAYTPLKRRHPLCILVGAVSGALPLWIGWSAAGSAANVWGWSALGVLFWWQVPHFLAIAWRRREDYQGAGYRVLPQADSSGRTTAAWALAGAVVTGTTSLAPVVAYPHLSAYLVLSALLNAWLIGAALRFLLVPSKERATALFRVSLWYLTGIYAAMLACAPRL